MQEEFNKSVHEVVLEKRYVCQKCFGGLTSYLKLKQRLSSSLESILDNIKKTINEAMPNIGEKRLSGCTSTQPRKKSHMQSEIIMNMGDSPAVSVSVLNN